MSGFHLLLRYRRVKNTRILTASSETTLEFTIYWQQQRLRPLHIAYSSLIRWLLLVTTLCDLKTIKGCDQVTNQLSVWSIMFHDNLPVAQLVNELKPESS